MAKKNELVTVHIPRARENEDPNLFVCINGKNYLLPKGKRSEVPAFVAEEIERSAEAQDRFEDYKAANAKAG